MVKFYEHTSFVVRMRLPEDAEPMTVGDFHNWLQTALVNDKGVVVQTYPAFVIGEAWRTGGHDGQVL